MTRRLEPEDLYAIKLVDDPQITPDGQHVAYVVVEIDRKTYEYHRTIGASERGSSGCCPPMAARRASSPGHAGEPVIPSGHRTAHPSSTQRRSVSRMIPKPRTPACTTSACPPSGESIASGIGSTA